MVVVKWSEETECNCCFLADSVIAFSDVPPWLQSQRPDLWCSPGVALPSVADLGEQATFLTFSMEEL